MMRLSVAIPTYNAGLTIGMALESVLRQTRPADEILVLNDGSTDDTVSILRSFGDRITLIEQENRGVAAARNALCAASSGDVIAFLDSDDIWHPRYLEEQRRNLTTFPDVVASFLGHVNFYGLGDYEWTDTPMRDIDRERIDPLAFLERYKRATGAFGSASFMCVRKDVLSSLGDEPFKVSGVEDSYVCTWLPLFGPVAYSPARLAAYRITEMAMSTDKLKAYGLWVEVFEKLEALYDDRASVALQRAFQEAFASKRRQYAKLLLGAGRRAEGRLQLHRSISQNWRAESVAKSVGLLLASWLPGRLQPSWPPPDRDWRAPRGVAEDR
jgi:glycosyltransferase involved in cell wall biosynthesis